MQKGSLYVTNEEIRGYIVRHDVTRISLVNLWETRLSNYFTFPMDSRFQETVEKCTPSFSEMSRTISCMSDSIEALIHRDLRLLRI